MNEERSLKLIGFSYGSMVLMMVVKESRYFPMNPESAIGSFTCDFGVGCVLLLGIVLIKLRHF